VPRIGAASLFERHPDAVNVWPSMSGAQSPRRESERIDWIQVPVQVRMVNGKETYDVVDPEALRAAGTLPPALQMAYSPKPQQSGANATTNTTPWRSPQQTQAYVRPRPPAAWQGGHNWTRAEFCCLLIVVKIVVGFIILMVV
jgi:hypothetical protein